MHSSFRFPLPKQIVIDNRRIKLPKIGWIGFYKSQEITGKVKNVTVSHQSGGWYISIQVEQEIETIHVANDNNKVIGIDVGIAKFATCVTLNSDQVYLAKHVYRKIEDKLRKEQRKLKNKQKFSRNWVKQTKKICKLHIKDCK